MRNHSRHAALSTPSLGVEYLSSAAAQLNGTDAEAQQSSILFVEDDVLLRLWAAEELRLAGFVVLEAANADEAMEVLGNAVPVDLVLTDIRMPGAMDGLGLAAVVRERWPELKIVVASGENAAKKALDTADDFVAKPYEPTWLVARIRKLLGLDK